MAFHPESRISREQALADLHEQERGQSFRGAATMDGRILHKPAGMAF